MKEYNKINVWSNDYVSSPLSVSLESRGEDEPTAGSSSALLSSQYYTQSDTEVEEEIHRSRRHKYDFNRSYETSKAGHFSHSPVKLYRRKRSLSSTALQTAEISKKQNQQYQNYDLLVQKQFTIQQRELQQQQQQQRHLIRRSQQQNLNIAYITSKRMTSERSRHSVRSSYRRNNNIVDMQTNSLDNLPRTRKKKINNCCGSSGNGGNTNTPKDRFYQQKIADYYRATARRNGHHFYNGSFENCNRQGKMAMTTARRLKYLRNTPISCGKKQQKFVEIDFGESDIEICTSPVLLDYCGPDTSLYNTPTPVLKENNNIFNELVNTQHSSNKCSVSEHPNIGLTYPPIPPFLPPPLPTLFDDNVYNYNLKSNKENIVNEPYVLKYNYENVNENLERYIYGNIVNNNEEDVDETQFINISDNIYENLKPVTMAFPTRSNSFKSKNNRAISSSTTTTSTVVCSSSSSSLPSSSSAQNAGSSSNCSSVTSGITTHFSKTPVFEDEPQLYGRLVRIAITEARQCDSPTIISRKIAETLLQLENLLFSSCTRRQSLTPLANGNTLKCNQQNGLVEAKVKKLQHFILPFDDDVVFEQRCTLLCHQIAEQLRHTRSTSLKDYNIQIRKIQKIVSQLKIATTNIQQQQQHNSFTQALFTASSIEAATAPNVSSGTFQRFFGRIRSIF